MHLACYLLLLCFLGGYLLTLFYSGLGRRQSTRLISPPIELSETRCLEMKIYTAGNLQIELLKLTESITQTEVLLDLINCNIEGLHNSTKLKEPFFWATFSWNVGPMNETIMDYRLVMTSIITSVEPGHHLVLDFLTLDDGPCPEQTSGSK